MFWREMKSDLGEAITGDAMIAAMGRAWTHGEAPIEMFVSHGTNRCMKAMLAYPNKWKSFLKGLDETESYLAAKYRRAENKS